MCSITLMLEDGETSHSHCTIGLPTYGERIVLQAGLPDLLQNWLRMLRQSSIISDVDLDIGSSPMSVNQSEGNEEAAPSSSSSFARRKRKRPLELGEFTTVFKEVMGQSNDTVVKLVENLSLVNQNMDQAIADELEQLGIAFSDRVVLLRHFFNKPEDSRVFKTIRNRADKFAFVHSLLQDDLCP